MTKTRAIALVSLGCPKNLVDSEYMADLLRDAGFVLSDNPQEAETIVVNTCGFIDSAKQEAIETILAMADFKKTGRCQNLIVTGCLAQRYPQEIQADLPEVDAILGVSAYGEIAQVVKRLDAQAQDSGGQIDEAKQAHPTLCHVGQEATTAHFKTKRKVSTGYYAYLKIAEGCSNRCAYCAIPGIRGPMISRPMESIVAEAKDLLNQDCRELVIVAQDTTAYGLDLYGKRALPELLRALADLPGDFGIRLLYCYSDGLTEALKQVVATEPKILKYIDMPIQHASDSVLKRMGRKDTKARIRQVVKTWREAIPGLVFRTTVMVGFPGETDEEYQELLELVDELKFERLGCFSFSPEEGTRAYDLPNPVDPEVAQAREQALMHKQRQVSLRFNEGRVGQVVRVLLESISEDGLFYLGRSAGESPDIDPVLYVLDEAQTAQLGQWVDVKLIQAEEYDLTGVTCSPNEETEECT